MPKMKSHSGAKKRLKKTGSGRLKRKKAYRRHILTKKTSKRKRHLRKDALVAPADEKNLQHLLNG